MAKILLVEDDNNLREIYEARLQAEGYTIVTAQDGEEALVTAKNEKPDLVISDVMMPKISGFEMLDILRNTDGLKEVKVIMLTALGQSDDQQRADRLGADRYLVKSQVTLEDIVKVSHELLGDEVAAAPDAEPAAAPAAETPAVVATPAPVSTPATPVTPVAAATPAPVAEPVVAPPAEPSVTVSTPPASTPSAIVPDNPVVQTAPTEPVAPVAAEPIVADPAPASTIVASEPVANQSASDVATPVMDSPVDAQSSDQEEASVEEKIEDFVSGATTDAGPAAPLTTSVDSPTDSSPAQSAVASDDAVMNQALNDIIASAPETAPIVAEPTVSAAPATPVEVPAVPTPTPAAAPAPTSTEVAPEPNDHVEIAHKKVIEPLNSEPKQDINELLAIEEAKEAAAAGPALPTAVVATNETPAVATPLTPAASASPISGAFAPNPATTVEGPSGGPAPTGPPAPGSTSIDPNSIAL